jgi:hypothetical protein
MRRLTVFFFLLAAASASYATRPFEVDTQSKVVVFADVHGAHDDLVSLLQEVQLIDADTNWVGGNTHLVSLGDLIDRGPGSRQVVELLMKLDGQALAAGGALHVVLGNHEVMVMSGDTRYVSRTEYAAFAVDETAEERLALLAEYRASRPDVAEEELLLQFEKYYPPGYLGLQRAYSPTGELGRWLLELPLVMRVNDRLYMHGGISGSIAESSLEKINTDNLADLNKYLSLVENLRDAGALGRHVGFWDRRAYLNTKAEAILAEDPKARPEWFEDFAALAELESAFLFTDNSPIWYRGSAYCHPYSESFNTERLLKRSGARQLVIGHTPHPQGVLQRLEGEVIRLDTGMLKAVYKGNGSALVIEGNEQYIHYLGAAEPQQPIVEDRSLSRDLWGMDDSQLEDLLKNGEIVSSEYIGTGVTKPKRLLVRKGNSETSAVFKYEDSNPGLESKKSYVARRHNDADRYQYDPAAYHLDRMINLEMVPVAVIRDVEGKEGAVGAWIPAAINERDRVEKEVEFTSYCNKDEQYRLRFVYDVLIYNDDRNLTNIVWTEKDFMLRFIDHSLAFQNVKKRPKQYRKIDLRVSDILQRQLESLNIDNVSQTLSPYLHPKQIEAIIVRRDLILKEALTTNP